MIKLVEIWFCSCNIPKSSRKQLQVACSRKWITFWLISTSVSLLILVWLWFGLVVKYIGVDGLVFFSSLHKFVISCDKNLKEFLMLCFML
jgi:hypothetical protein